MKPAKADSSISEPSVSPREVLAEIRRQPFEPFTIRMTDRAAFEIRHPDQCPVL